ncbi:hypothetical protein ACA910_006179 [Epithemia clementina (nom. ined.)]
MRLVLLSPLIVLVLWSVSAVLFASSSSSRQAEQMINQPKAMLIKQKHQQLLQKRKRGISLLQQQQQPQAQLSEPMMMDVESSPVKDFLKEGLLEVVELSGDLLGEAQPPGLVGDGEPVPYVQSLLAAAQPEDLPLLQRRQSQQDHEQQDQHALPVIIPLGATQQGGGSHHHHLHDQSGGSNAATVRAAHLVHSVEDSVEQYLHPYHPPQPHHTAVQTRKKRLNTLPSSHNSIIVQPQRYREEATPQLRGSSNNRNTKKKKVVYYYYDPKSTVVGSDGQLYLPNIVYDQNGNAWNTNSIARGGTTQVFVQPPPPFGTTYYSKDRSYNNGTTTSQVAPPHPPVPEEQPAYGSAYHYQSSSTNNSTSTMSSVADEEETENVLEEEQIAPPIPPMPVPIQGISFPAIKNDIHQAVQRAEDRYQENGSSVIVATVAVMALLVGALSARKLRGRASILNACIENERLDHMSAVDDTATETNNTAYSTFHWKGDLEKFDV